MKIKHVLLRDFNIKPDVARFKSNKDIEIKWYQDQDSKKNGETYASFIGDSKSDINNQLASLNNRIMSERVRTLKEIPKCRIIKTKVEHKPEMVEEIKEYY